MDIKFLFASPTLLLSASCIVLISTYIAFKEGKKSKSKAPYLLLALAGIVNLVASLKNNYETDKQSEKILGYQIELKQYDIDLKKANMELSKSMIKTINSQSQLLSLSEGNRDLLTGGVCHAYVALGSLNDSVYWNLFHTCMGGKSFPVFDLRLTIIDRTAEYIAANTGADHKGSIPQQESIYIGNVFPPDHNTIKKEDMAGKTFKAYLIHFSARNGKWSEEVIMLKTDKGWKTARKLFPSVYMTVVNKIKSEIYTDEGYPKDAVPTHWKTASLTFD